MNIVQRAIEIATTNHAGQFRKANKGGYKIPYVVHPIQVMKVVFDWGAGTPMNLAAAACHDLMEDTSITKEYLVKELGQDVANIVEELTFDDQGHVKDSKSKYLESFKDKSLNALLIKLADRACNVQDFVNGGDGEYASKYAAKAQPLYDAAMDRLDEIESVYGFQTRQIVYNVLGELLTAALQHQLADDIASGSFATSKGV